MRSKHHEYTFTGRALHWLYTAASCRTKARHKAGKSNSRVVVEVVARLASADPAVGRDGPVVTSRLGAVVNHRGDRGDEDLAVQGARVALWLTLRRGNEVVNTVLLPVWRKVDEYT